MQVIIYQNPQADNVCVCVPTGEISIQEVLAKDCPSGATIVDSATLPQDNTYFDAWRLVDGVVVVDLEAAKVIGTNSLNAWAAQTAAQRSLNAAIGITPVLDDPSFIAALDAGRSAIAASTSTAEVTAAVAAAEQAASGT